MGLEPLVRRVVPADWVQLRALRLQALADTPIAYLESLEQALSYGEDVWRARAVRSSEGGDSVQLLAFVDDRAVATAVGFVDPERADTAVLAAVYLAPDRRGTGLLEELVDRVSGWAAGTGRTALRLWVHEDNERARSAYARLEFAETGQTMAYPLDQTRRELAMERLLR